MNQGLDISSTIGMLGVEEIVLDSNTWPMNDRSAKCYGPHQSTPTDLKSVDCRVDHRMHFYYEPADVFITAGSYYRCSQ